MSKIEVSHGAPAWGHRFATAADAVVAGHATDVEWETLGTFIARDGVEAIAEALNMRCGPTGPSSEWWRFKLSLASDLTSEVQPSALEVARRPEFDVDEHALQVSAAVRYLQNHLQRLRAGLATTTEHSAAGMVVHAARVARRVVDDAAG